MMFPERELEIIRLAEDVAKGFAEQRQDFPAPPFSAEEIGQRLSTYQAAREVAQQDRAREARSFALKNEALRAVVEAAKAAIKYAESMAGREPAKLRMLGWGPRRSPGSNAAVPGQVATLAISEQGKTWIALAWRQPFDGGRVSAYRVQRRKPGGEWVDVGTSLGTDITLSGQDAGAELEYQVLAINKAGAGPASNIVRAVL
jgi:hypothetical protein